MAAISLQRPALFVQPQSRAEGRRRVLFARVGQDGDRPPGRRDGLVEATGRRVGRRQRVQVGRRPVLCRLACGFREPNRLGGVAERGIPAGRRVVAYCHSGQRSELAAALLREAGVDAVNYEGSWHEWSRREAPG